MAGTAGVVLRGSSIQQTSPFGMSLICHESSCSVLSSYEKRHSPPRLFILNANFFPATPASVEERTAVTFKLDISFTLNSRQMSVKCPM